MKITLEDKIIKAFILLEMNMNINTFHLYMNS